MTSYSDLAHFNFDRDFLCRASRATLRALGWEIYEEGKTMIRAKVSPEENGSSAILELQVFTGHLLYTVGSEKYSFDLFEYKDLGNVFLAKLRETIISDTLR